MLARVTRRVRRRAVTEGSGGSVACRWDQYEKFWEIGCLDIGWDAMVVGSWGLVGSQSEVFSVLVIWDVVLWDFFGAGFYLSPDDPFVWGKWRAESWSARDGSEFTCYVLS